MLKVLVLICAASIDPQHCNRDTALDMVMSQKVGTPQQCGFMGEVAVASTVLADPKSQYIKVMCIHEREASR